MSYNHTSSAFQEIRKRLQDISSKDSKRETVLNEAYALLDVCIKDIQDAGKSFARKDDPEQQLTRVDGVYAGLQKMVNQLKLVLLSFSTADNQPDSLSLYRCQGMVSYFSFLSTAANVYTKKKQHEKAITLCERADAVFREARILLEALVADGAEDANLLFFFARFLMQGMRFFANYTFAVHDDANKMHLRGYRALLHQELLTLNLPVSHPEYQEIQKHIEHYNIKEMGSENALKHNLEVAQNTYISQPENEAYATDYAWLLYDVIKQALHENSLDIARTYLVNAIAMRDKLLTMKRVGSAAKYAKGVASLEKRINDPDPTRALANRAYQLSQEKRHQDAAVLYERIFRQVKESDAPEETLEKRRNQLAWEWIHLLSEMTESIKKERKPSDTLEQLKELGQLRFALLERIQSLGCADAKIQCRIVKQLVKLRETLNPLYPRAYLTKMLQLPDEVWDIKEIHKPTFYGKKRTNPLAEDVMRWIHASLKSLGDEERSTYLEEIKHIVIRCHENATQQYSMSAYYLACIHVWLDQPQEAVHLLSEFIIWHWDQGWAWGKMAYTPFSDPQINVELAARAVVCPCSTDGRDYANGLLRKYGNSMRPSGEPLDQKTVNALALKAEQRIYRNLPKYKAVVVSAIETEQSKKNAHRYSWKTYLMDVLLQRDDEVIRVHQQMLLSAPPELLEEGAPVSIRLRDRDGGRRLLALVPRSRAKKWDILTAEIGVITKIYKSRNLCVATVGTDEITLTFSAYPDAASWEVGTFIAIKRVPDQSGKLLEVIRSNRKPDPSSCKTFSGKVSPPLPNGSAWVDDVFVPYRTLSRARIKPGERVEGMAVIKREDDRKNWRAVTLKKQHAQRTNRHDML